MLVSIIIPCYNVEAYVSEALNSALAQTHRPLEIIAVDNNSTDGTKHILLDYQRRCPDLITVLEEKKQGAPAARNLGLRFARGEWIQFLDADDLILEQKLENQMRLAAASQKNVAVIAGAYEYVHHEENSKVFIPEGQDTWLSLIKGEFGITSSMLWRKSALLEAGGWNEEQESSQEYELLFRILKLGGEAATQASVDTLVRRRPNSISTTDSRESWKRAVILHLEIYKYFRKLSPESACRAEYLNAVIGLIGALSLFSARDAIKEHNELIPNRFRIKNSAVSRSFRYPYNFFGFRPAIFIFRNFVHLQERFGF